MSASVNKQLYVTTINISNYTRENLQKSYALEEHAKFLLRSVNSIKPTSVIFVQL